MNKPKREAEKVQRSFALYGLQSLPPNKFARTINLIVSNQGGIVLPKRDFLAK